MNEHLSTEQADKLKAEIENSLTKDEHLLSLAKLIGYEKLPPTVEQILDDDYYLYHVGKDLYPVWRERLEELFPDPITTSSSIVIAKGAIGSGKSFFSMLIQAIDLIKWGHHPDPLTYLGLSGLTSPVFIRMFNMDKAKATAVLVDPFLRIVHASPYFKENAIVTGHKLPHGLQVAPAKRGGDIISEVLLGAIFSEANFFPHDKAEDIIATILSRLTSRMQRGIGLFNHVILDSSDTEEDSVIEEFIRKESKWADELSIYSTPIWEAKRHQNLFFQKEDKSFQVYCGDTGRLPFIMNVDDQAEDVVDLDPDRIIEVPTELYPNYELDIVKALQETAGISANVKNKFFWDKGRLSDRFNIRSELQDLIILDFYDNEELWDVIGKRVLELLPEDRKYYCRLDLGVVKDMAGIAICYADEAEMVEIEGQKILKGSYKIPVAIALGRKVGQETPIHKIKNFFVALNKHRSIALVTTDQYQSTQLIQELTLEDIEAELLSVDRTDNAFVTSKNLILKGQVDMADNQRFLKEALELVRVGQKVDHPAKGSKDICDAAFGALFSCYSDSEDAFTETDNNKLTGYSDLLNTLRDGRRTRQLRHRR